MKTYSANAAEELTAWLVLATFGLIAPARERIKREIEAHFADAVVAHVAEGLSQDAAEAKALEELGNIHSAAKGFQKKHMTEKEEKWLQSLLTENSSQQHNRRMRFLIALFASTLLTIFLIWRLDHKGVWMSWIWLVPPWSFILFSTAATLRLSYFTKHGLAGLKLWRKFLALDLVNDVFNGMIMFTFLLADVSTDRRLVLFFWCLLVLYLSSFGLFFFDKRFRLWRKLGYSIANPDTAMKA